MALVFILTRLLLMACLVFIIGYVFGNFSKSKALTAITRIASIVLVVSVFATGFLFFRVGKSARRGHINYNEMHDKSCFRADSTVKF